MRSKSKMINVLPAVLLLVFSSSLVDSQSHHSVILNDNSSSLFDNNNNNPDSNVNNNNNSPILSSHHLNKNTIAGSKRMMSYSLRKDVVLLDTTKENSLDWSKYPFGPDSETPGWVEESFTDFEKGIHWRSYVVCDVAYNNVNNWLWTPFIEKPDDSIKRLYIEIKFSMRDCNLFPGMALSCKETFSLYYHEDDNPVRANQLNSALSVMEAPKVESFKLIDRIASDEGRFTSNSEVIINTEVRSIPMTKRGVHFAFRDQGACLSLISIKIYYIVCSRVVSGLAVFPETPTGQELTSFVTVNGACVPNSSPIEDAPPKLICKGDGNWTLPSGGCRCNDGFESTLDNNGCKPIPGWKRMPDSNPTAYPRRPTASSSNFTFLTENLPKRNFSDIPKIRHDSMGKEMMTRGYQPANKHLQQTNRNSTKEYYWIAGVTAAILAILGVIVLVVIVYLKRHNEDCSKKQPSDCDTLEYTRAGEGVSASSLDHHPPLVPTARFNTLHHTYMSPYAMNMNGMSSSSSSGTTKVSTTPIFTHYSQSPSYVETHTYEDPNQILPLTTMKGSVIHSNNSSNSSSSTNSTTIPTSSLLNRDHLGSLIHASGSMHHPHHHTLLHHHQIQPPSSFSNNHHHQLSNCVSYGAASADQQPQSHQSTLPYDFHDITRTLNSIRTNGRRTNL